MDKIPEHTFRCRFSHKAIMLWKDVTTDQMFKDKKVKNELINFVMVRSIGEAFITNEVDLGVVSQVIEQSR